MEYLSVLFTKISRFAAVGNPILQEMKKALLKVRNRHEQLYRKAVVAYMQAKSDRARIAALNLMRQINADLAEMAGAKTKGEEEPEEIRIKWEDPKSMHKTAVIKYKPHPGQVEFPLSSRKVSSAQLWTTLGQNRCRRKRIHKANLAEGRGQRKNWHRGICCCSNLLAYSASMERVLQFLPTRTDRGNPSGLNDTLC